MTKIEEQKLLKRIDTLERTVADLYSYIESTRLDKHVYSVAEVSKILEITPQAVYKMLDRGELETIKLGHLKVLGSSLREKLGVS